MPALSALMAFSSSDKAASQTANELTRLLRQSDHAVQQLQLLQAKMDEWEKRLQSASSGQRAAFQYSLGLGVEALWQFMLVFECYEEEKWLAIQRLAMSWLQRTGQEIVLTGDEGQQLPVLDPVDLVDDVVGEGLDEGLRALAMEDSEDSDSDDSRESSEADSDFVSGNSEDDDVDDDDEYEDGLMPCTDQLQCFVSWDLYNRQC